MRRGDLESITQRISTRVTYLPRNRAGPGRRGETHHSIAHPHQDVNDDIELHRPLAFSADVPTRRRRPNCSRSLMQVDDPSILQAGTHIRRKVRSAFADAAERFGGLCRLAFPGSVLRPAPPTPTPPQEHDRENQFAIRRLPTIGGRAPLLPDEFLTPRFCRCARPLRNPPVLASRETPAAPSPSTACGYRRDLRAAEDRSSTVHGARQNRHRA